MGLIHYLSRIQLVHCTINTHYLANSYNIGPVHFMTEEKKYSPYDSIRYHLIFVKIRFIIVSVYIYVRYITFNSDEDVIVAGEILNNLGFCLVLKWRLSKKGSLYCYSCCDKGLVFIYDLILAFNDKPARYLGPINAWPHDYKLRKFLSLKLDFEYIKFYWACCLNNLQIWTKCNLIHIFKILVHYQNYCKSNTSLKIWLKNILSL